MTSFRRFHTCPLCQRVVETAAHDEKRCVAQERLGELLTLIPAKRDEAITLRRKNGDMVGSSKETRAVDEQAATAEMQRLALLEELFDVCATVFGTCTTGGGE